MRLLDRAPEVHSLLGSIVHAAKMAWACLFLFLRAVSPRGELIHHGVLLGRGWVLLVLDSVLGHLLLGKAAWTA